LRELSLACSVIAGSASKRASSLDPRRASCAVLKGARGEEEKRKKKRKRKERVAEGDRLGRFVSISNELSIHARKHGETALIWFAVDRARGTCYGAR